MADSTTAHLIRPFAIAFFVFCLLALVPALLMFHIGMGWVWNLAWPGNLSAAAMIATPLPLGIGAYYARKAALEASGRHLFIAAVVALLIVPLCAIVWVWGGRMLI